MPGPKEAEIHPHAIQLNYVGVKELHFESTRLPSTIDSSEYGEPMLSVARSEYNESNKTIQVFAKFELEGKKDDQQFILRVEMASEFRVNEDVFPRDKIVPWADRAAFYVLFPFLREHVYSLAIRVGLKPFMLPLMEVPTFKVERPVTKATAESASPVPVGK